MAVRTKKQPSTKARAKSQASKKGWATRRAKEEAARKAALARSRAAKKAAETRARKKRAAEEAAAKRRASAKKGARTRAARERAHAALSTFVEAVDRKTRFRELERVKESWHKAKAELEGALGDDYDRYLEILDELADDVGTQWDIAYGSTESAA